MTACCARSQRRYSEQLLQLSLLVLATSASTPQSGGPIRHVFLLIYLLGPHSPFSTEYYGRYDTTVCEDSDEVVLDCWLLGVLRSSKQINHVILSISSRMPSTCIEWATLLLRKQGPLLIQKMEAEIQAQIPGLDRVISEYSVVCSDPNRGLR